MLMDSYLMLLCVNRYYCIDIKHLTHTAEFALLRDNEKQYTFVCV